MQPTPRLFPLVLAALVWALPAMAGCGTITASAPAAGPAPAVTYYMAPSEVDLVHVLPPPPAPGSAAQQSDLQAVLDAQATRTATDIASARGDATMSVLRFADVLGPGFAAAKLPFALGFFERVHEDDEHAVAAAKAAFGRPRPFVTDAAIHPVVQQPPNASYPSGHSTFAYVNAILLADMLPERAAAIFSRAAVYAHNRVIAGVHYPTDIEAGKISGAVIDNVLLHKPGFLADFERAKREVRQALGLTG